MSRIQCQEPRACYAEGCSGRPVPRYAPRGARQQARFFRDHARPDELLYAWRYPNGLCASFGDGVAVSTTRAGIAVAGAGQALGSPVLVALASGTRVRRFPGVPDAA